MAKVTSFIDGFNLYHSLVQQDRRGRRLYSKFRWIDYWKLTECFLTKGDILVDVYYFTAYAAWKTKAGIEKRRKHQQFIEVQKDRGVKVVLGRFRPVQRRCRASCKQIYSTYEEKRTDVNIAVTMLKLALMNQYDKGILISADSDLIPALKAIKSVRTSIQMMVVAPVGRSARALSNAADYNRHMKPSHLKRSLLPQIVSLSDGRRLNCPGGWR